MESLSFLEEFEEVQNVKNKPGNGDPLLDLSQWCNQYQVLEEQNLVNWESTNQDPIKAEEEPKPPLRKRQAPPIPPRTTSWHLSSPSAPKLEFPLPESFTDKKCHSPYIVTDRKCPSVLKKFGEMLQENEGYTLTKSGVVATPVPTDSKCNIGCCHSSWSCNGSRFGSSKSSTYVPVQKCPSDANVQEAEMDCNPEGMPSDNPKCPGGQFQPVDKDFDTLDFRVPSSGVPPPYQNAKAPLINETLERKTAEFNRTLFQAEMGLGVEDSVTPAEVCVSGRNSSPQHSEIKLRDVMSDPPPLYPDLTPKAMTSDLKPEIKPKVTTSDLPPQNLRDKELEAPAVVSNLSAFKQYVPSMVRAKSPGARAGTTVRQMDKAKSLDKVKSGNTGSSARGISNIGSWVLKDQPWKPTTLAAYPRPADSRSNYGAVEKILKSYESSGGSQCYLQRRHGPVQEVDLIELLDNLEVKQQLSSRDTSTRPGLRRETGSTMQESREPPFSPVKKSFSRPACPANRRLPSRWATRSPTAHSAPFTHPSVTIQTRTFSYSNYTETGII
ncbi:protein SOGA3a [Conger conger]|uniref:protein SOGA3a n=1 Tax=Conger conger TaxID=82655 RepID=UPI002A59F45B|nr:protein SOGA3a [Conger conger]